jgi:hypothetical protein
MICPIGADKHVVQLHQPRKSGRWDPLVVRLAA